MAQQLSPICVKECLKLSDFGINTDNGLNTLTLNSGFICAIVKLEAVILDVHHATIISKFPVTTTSTAMLNPNSKNIAIIDVQKTKDATLINLQLCNIERRTKIKLNTNVNGNVKYWQWINDHTISLVTDKTVYHWNVSDYAQPVKMFDRNVGFENKIIDYCVDGRNRWSLITTCRDKDTDDIGSMDLYNVESKISQSIIGRVACFIQYKPSENSTTTLTLLCYCIRGSTGVTLHIKQVGDDNRVQARVDGWLISESRGDIPIAMHACDQFGLIFVVMKCGSVHLYDIGTSVCLFKNQITQNDIIISAKCDQRGGLICVDQKGQVFNLSIDQNDMVIHVMERLQNEDLACQLTIRFADNPQTEIIHHSASPKESKVALATSPLKNIPNVVRSPSIRAPPVIPRRPSQGPAAAMVSPAPQRSAPPPPPLPLRPQRPAPKPLPPEKPATPPKTTVTRSNSNVSSRNSDTGTLCIICEDAEKCVMIEPCHHISMCRPCANKIFEQQSQCPTCRGRIKALTDVFLS